MCRNRSLPVQVPKPALSHTSLHLQAIAVQYWHLLIYIITAIKKRDIFCMTILCIIRSKSGGPLPFNTAARPTQHSFIMWTPKPQRWTAPYAIHHGDSTVFGTEIQLGRHEILRHLRRWSSGGEASDARVVLPRPQAPPHGGPFTAQGLRGSWILEQNGSHLPSPRPRGKGRPFWAVSRRYPTIFTADGSATTVAISNAVNSWPKSSSASTIRILKMRALPSDWPWACTL
jgi:hypothetical protein